MGAASSYPRPDFERTALHWESLNGPWDFLFDDEDRGLSHGWCRTGLPSHALAGPHYKPQAKRTIQVPFVFQAPASGVNEQSVHEVLWYERLIEDIRSREEREASYRLLLRFGAVDYHTKVWLNGFLVGEHKGGHVPFEFDLSEAPWTTDSGPPRLTIRVFDSATDLAQPRGKQYWGAKAEDIWYTPSSGIWQSVWLESVPPMRILDSLAGTSLLSTDIERGLLNCSISIHGRRVGQACSVEVESRLAGVKVSSDRHGLPHHEDLIRFDLHMRLNEQQMNELPAEFKNAAPAHNDKAWRYNVALWSPEHPTLYEIIIRLYDSFDNVVDEVKTTAGMRSLTWTTGDGTFRLNNRPYFHCLFLDQGYWPETLMTPPSREACVRDIELSKAMGFNGCRKHQKLEDPIFLYHADRLGFLVWSEMPSTHTYDPVAVSRFDKEYTTSILRDRNHPSVVCWTPVNESWGHNDLHHSLSQRHHLRTLYHTTHLLDSTRPVNDNCGWEHVATDLTTFHDYADAAGMRNRAGTMDAILHYGRPLFLPPIYDKRGGEVDPGSRHKAGAPVLCTEFGGVNVAVLNDESRKANWGYTTAADGEDLLRRVRDLVMGTVESGLCCGIVWTQFSDIEQEQNGLYTYDRREKVEAARVKEVMEEAARIYYAKREER